MGEIMTVTKQFEFEAAHLLPDYPGKCKHLHGHTYKLEVEVGGPPVGRPLLSVYPTMVVDFGDLKNIVESSVVAHLDHAYLNDIIDIPTAEALVGWIFTQLEPTFKNRLQRIRLYETSDSYAEWRSA